MIWLMLLKGIGIQRFSIGGHDDGYALVDGAYLFFFLFAHTFDRIWDH